jgi:hypothetical protein
MKNNIGLIKAMPLDFDIQHFRLLWLIYRHPNGLSAQQLVEELKAHGWCDASTTARDLGMHPEDVVCRPRAAANDP